MLIHNIILQKNKLIQASKHLFIKQLEVFTLFIDL